MKLKELKKNPYYEKLKKTFEKEIANLDSCWGDVEFIKMYNTFKKMGEKYGGIHKEIYNILVLFKKENEKDKNL